MVFEAFSCFSFLTRATTCGRAPRARDVLSRLPPDVLERILSFISLSDATQLAQVCWGLREAVRRQVWRELVLPMRTAEGDPDEAGMRALSRAMDAGALGGVRRLRIAIPPAGSRPRAGRQPRRRRARPPRRRRPPPEVEVVRAGAGDILSGAFFSDLAAILALAAQGRPALRRLSLAFADRSLSERGRAGFWRLLLAPWRIAPPQSLALGDGLLLDGPAAAAIAESLPRLRRLHVGPPGAGRARLECLEPLSVLPLESLRLSGAFGPGEEGEDASPQVASLALGPAGATLRELSLDFDPGEGGLRALSPLPRLEELALRVSNRNASGAMFLGFMKSLRWLTVSAAETPSVDLLGALASSLRRAPVLEEVRVDFGEGAGGADGPAFADVIRAAGHRLLALRAAVASDSADAMRALCGCPRLAELRLLFLPPAEDGWAAPLSTLAAVLAACPRPPALEIRFAGLEPDEDALAALEILSGVSFAPRDAGTAQFSLVVC
eukprot:tig00000391_g24867.t1